MGLNYIGLNRIILKGTNQHTRRQPALHHLNTIHLYSPPPPPLNSQHHHHHHHHHRNNHHHITTITHPDRPLHVAALQQLPLPRLPQEPLPRLLRARAERVAVDRRPAADPPDEGAAGRGVQRRGAGVRVCVCVRWMGEEGGVLLRGWVGVLGEWCRGACGVEGERGRGVLRCAFAERKPCKYHSPPNAHAQHAPHLHPHQNSHPTPNQNQNQKYKCKNNRSGSSPRPTSARSRATACCTRASRTRASATGSRVRAMGDGGFGGVRGGGV